MAHFLLVILSLLLQAHTVGKPDAAVENELDTLYLPATHPEYVLAKRALASNGLCPTPGQAGFQPGFNASAPRDSALIPNGNFLAVNCP